MNPLRGCDQQIQQVAAMLVDRSFRIIGPLDEPRRRVQSWPHPDRRQTRLYPADDFRQQRDEDLHSRYRIATRRIMRPQAQGRDIG
jgi:hypothetical protein